MNDEEQNSSRRAIVIAVVSLAVIATVVVFFQSRQEAREPVPQSTEWVTRPAGGVEVDLPDTPMKAVPIDPAEGEAGGVADPDEGE